MRVVKPITITPQNYSFSGWDFPTEDLQPEWVATTSYVLNNKVSYLGYVYNALTSITGSSSNLPPPSDTTRWEKVKVQNVQAPFDTQTSTAANAISATASYTITPYFQPYIPAKVDTLSCFNVSGFNRVTLKIFDTSAGFPLLYEKEVILSSLEVNDWYDYFFEDEKYKNEVVFDNLPPAIYTDYLYEITFYNDNYSPIVDPFIGSVGVIVLGKSISIGQTQMGASAGIIDYSRKVTDDFGTTTFVERAFSKRVNCSVIVENGSINNLYSLFSQIRATPCLWLGTAYEEYGPLNVFGYYKDFNIDIAYPKQSLVSIEIEGLA